MDALNLPQYERIDRVRAARITGWSYINDFNDAQLTLEGGLMVEVGSDFMEWNAPEIGDYYMISNRGIAVTMRRQAFESLYSRPGLAGIENLASMRAQAVIVKRDAPPAEQAEPVLGLEMLTKMVLNKGAE